MDAFLHATTPILLRPRSPCQNHVRVHPRTSPARLSSTRTCRAGLSTISTSSSRFPRRCSLPAGKEARVLRPGRIAALGFSPDGKRLVTASGERQDARLKIWELGTGKELM